MYMLQMQWQLSLESFEPAVLKSRAQRASGEKNYSDVQTSSEPGFIEDLRSLLLKGEKMFEVAQRASKVAWPQGP